jgi:PilZ domain
MESVSVYWRCNGRDGVAHVRDLSLGGMFIETSIPLPVGAVARIDLLVQEGQISADVVVRHIKPACGMGLNFTAMLEDDRARLWMLIRRLRDSSQTQNYKLTND